VDKEEMQNYIRVYNRHKKRTPTAGVILCHQEQTGGQVHFVVVRMRFSNVWSMPKGKKEPKEELMHTAKREFLEETGIDLEDLIRSETMRRIIGKTCFYLIESDDMDIKFEGYNNKEIDEVKWVSAVSVTRNDHLDAGVYSKQTIAVAKYLLDRQRATGRPTSDPRPAGQSRGVVQAIPVPHRGYPQA
jgi:8-oxo-dGTP pyrophosphatase MutT (NUDIX family)